MTVRSCIRSIWALARQPLLLCQGDAICLVQLGENELSAHQESALAPLNCTALAAGCDSIACTRYALNTNTAGLQCSSAHAVAARSRVRN